MQILRKDVNPLLTQIEITIEPGDYVEKFETNLKKYKNKAQIKGFRKGMIPMNTLKKMYGKSLLVDTVYEELNDLFNQYLKEQKINTLGSPLPSEGFEPDLNFDMYNYNSFTFHFDVGIVPEYQIAGISESDVYDFDDVTIDSTTIDENIQDFLKRHGKPQEVDEPIEDNDILEIQANELNEDQTPFDKGWSTEFSVLVSSIKDDEVKTKLLSQKIGFSFVFDITKLENPDPAFIDKYLLNRTEADKDVVIGNMFSGTVVKIKRQVPAVLSENFFEELADEKIKSESDLREVIEKELKQSYDRNANSLLERKIFDKIKEETNLDISPDFYKRLIQQNENNKDVEITDEDLNKSIESTKWMLIKEDLFRKYALEVNEGEIKNHFFQQVMSYFKYYPNMDYNIVFDFVEKQMKNQNALEKATEEIKVSKLFNQLTGVVGKNKIAISSTDFLKKVESMQPAE
ncbi:MAG: hypothetical protein IPL63_08575 [Saprospiraceae bacterium]|nr:hypothetical protein [Saprospiraceae bacterium]MBK7524112.1 hypothetical protein [Saprospiraceae bacterium]MBK8078909.1 hypothetical protein [Saprospiraceae bacterium]MBK8372164.1 hypothetical protein [Saprospiraceae bacterium]MBK8547431.1 hypothetical protein [Saprospiraceae bacterium]